MKICVLNSTEVARLANYNIAPNCAQHVHISPSAALGLVQQDTHRAVTDKAITTQSSNDRVWRGRPSGNHNVLQLVRP